MYKYSENKILLGRFGKVYRVLVGYSGTYLKEFLRDYETGIYSEDNRIDLERLSSNLGISRFRVGVTVKEIMDCLGYRFEWDSGVLKKVWVPVFFDKIWYDKYKDKTLVLSVKSGTLFKVNSVYVYVSYGRDDRVRVHREIAKTSFGKQTDHLDRFPIDNTESNLFPVTNSENQGKRINLEGSEYLKGVFKKNGKYSTSLSFYREGIRVLEEVTSDNEDLLGKIHEWYMIECFRIPNYNAIYSKIEIKSLLKDLDTVSLDSFLKAVWGIDKNKYYSLGMKIGKYSSVCELKNGYSLCLKYKGVRRYISKNLRFYSINDALSVKDFIDFRILKRPVSSYPEIECITTKSRFIEVLGRNLNRFVDWLERMDKESVSFQGCLETWNNLE